MGLSGTLQQQRATRTDSESEVLRLTRRGRQPNQLIGERGIDLYRAYLSLYFWVYAGDVPPDVEFGVAAAPWPA